MKKVMLTIPDEIYELLVSVSKESLRPIATEALYRLKMGLLYQTVGMRRPDDLYSEESLNKMVLRGTNPILSYGEGKPFVGTIQNENSEKTKDTQGLADKINNAEPHSMIPVDDDELAFLNKRGSIENIRDIYSDVIEWIEKINDPEYQSDSEERSKVNKMVKDAGLSYNARDKKLWKQEGEKWILIKEF